MPGSVVAFWGGDWGLPAAGWARCRLMWFGAICVTAVWGVLQRGPEGLHEPEPGPFAQHRLRLG
ncbi:MAG: hypothetical protein NZM37_03670 [Sandaracinaceae bacterium]|nr:hypothetical protein [Sandaracinaceae bacterium]